MSIYYVRKVPQNGINALLGSVIGRVPASASERDQRCNCRTSRAPLIGMQSQAAGEGTLPNAPLLLQLFDHSDKRRNAPPATSFGPL